MLPLVHGSVKDVGAQAGRFRVFQSPCFTLTVMEASNKSAAGGSSISNVKKKFLKTVECSMPASIKPFPC